MKKYALGVLFCIIVLGVAIRIYAFQTSALRIPVEVYPENTWVALANTVQGEAQPEEYSSQNYSVSVVSAQLMSAKEYLESCGASSDDEAFSGDNLAVACVELSVKNDGDNLGSLDPFEMILKTPAQDDYLLADVYEEDSLFQRAYPESNGYISIKPHTIYTVKIPYVVNEGAPEMYQEQLHEGSYYLLLSHMPKRMWIKVDVEA